LLQQRLPKPWTLFLTVQKKIMNRFLPTTHLSGSREEEKVLARYFSIFSHSTKEELQKIVTRTNEQEATTTLKIGNPVLRGLQQCK
jgi:hypothetical protein